EMQRALISSDVEVGLVLELSKRIEAAAFEELPKGLDRRAHLIKETYDLLAKLLGEGMQKAPEKPRKILLVGLYGSGKTTTAGKLGRLYSKKGLKVGAVCADTYRAAAYQQLKTVCEKAGIDFYGNPEEKRPETIVYQALTKFKSFDLIIVDSAGRSALDEELVREIKEVHHAFEAENVWLVLSADIGQVAGKQAKAFHEAVGINGVIITKTDGSAKGGGALAACRVTNSPVHFIGTGEKVNDLEEFEPQRYLSRIMGYGDLQALLEKAKEAAEEQQLNPEELLSGDFNLKVFYEQLEAAKKMGPLSKVMEMMGMGTKLPKEVLEVSEKKLAGFGAIMNSMTKQEKLEPEIISRQRVERIAKGSGKSANDVRELLKQYKQMKKMFKRFKQLGSAESLDQKGLAKLMKGMKGMQQKKKFKIR
ncbi:MAG: signal recognition particle protein Srp19, partial [archaeon]